MVVYQFPSQQPAIEYCPLSLLPPRFYSTLRLIVYKSLSSIAKKINLLFSSCTCKIIRVRSCELRETRKKGEKIKWKQIFDIGIEQANTRFLFKTFSMDTCVATQTTCKAKNLLNPERAGLKCRTRNITRMAISN